MKRIHFDNMKNSFFWIFILILSVIFIGGGTFELFQFENAKSNKWMSVVGFFLQAIYFSKMFWYKNYVQWNKKNALIKINSFMGKSLVFDEIKTFELNDKKLKITKINDNTVIFDLNDIVESDTQKLNKLMVKNTFINNI